MRLTCLVCQELQLPMLKVSAPEMVSGVSGESEQKLRELFDLAVVSPASILWIQNQIRTHWGCPWWFMTAVQPCSRCWTGLIHVPLSPSLSLTCVCRALPRVSCS